MKTVSKSGGVIKNSRLPLYSLLLLLLFLHLILLTAEDGFRFRGGGGHGSFLGILEPSEVGVLGVEDEDVSRSSSDTDDPV